MHVLISLAKRRPYAAVPTLPPGAYYDRSAARWRTGDRFLVETGAPPLQTKKCDQETGEDQKGE
jgi:hypothetical protein